MKSAISLKRWSGRRDSNPRRPAWEAGILPLNYSRTRGFSYTIAHRFALRALSRSLPTPPTPAARQACCSRTRCGGFWGMVGSNRSPCHRATPVAESAGRWGRRYRARRFCSAVRRPSRARAGNWPAWRASASRFSNSSILPGEQIEPRPSGVLLVRRQQPRGIVVGRFEDAAAIERFLPANHPADLRLREERLLLPVALESEAGRRHFGEDRRAIVRTRTIHGTARDPLPTECVRAGARLQRGDAQQIYFESSVGPRHGTRPPHKPHAAHACIAESLLFRSFRQAPRHALALRPRGEVPF